MPAACKECGSALKKDDEEVVWRCPNESCPAKIRRGLEHFASRGAMNIEGLGASLIDQLVEQQLVGDFADLYRLEAAQLESAGRCAARTAIGTGTSAQAGQGRPQRRRRNRAQQERTTCRG